MAKKVNVDVIRDIGAYYSSHSGPTMLKDVITLLSGYDVIPFDRQNPDDVLVLANLKKAAKIAVKNIQKDKIRSRRANEVGNLIEPFVRNALVEIGYDAHVPKTTSGLHKAAGYPDIEFTDKAGRITLAYVECKTYNHRNISTTQRSFYLSPSDDFKITANAHHFVISLEIEEEIGTRENGVNIYTAKGWKILDVANLPMDLKIEFNSDNNRMYGKKYGLIIAEDDDETQETLIG